MREMTDDLACVQFIPEDNVLETSFEFGILFVNGDLHGDGQ